MRPIDGMSNSEATALAVVKLGQVHLRMQSLLVRVLGVKDVHQLNQKVCQGHPELSAAVGKIWDAHCASLSALQAFPGWKNLILDGPNEWVYPIEEPSGVK